MHFILFNSQVYSGMDPSHHPPTHFSSRPLIRHKGHSGREYHAPEDGLRVPHVAATQCRWLSESLYAYRRQASPCSVILYKAATCKHPERSISIQPAEHLDPRGSGSAGGWTRAQEPGWVLTPELKGQTLAALSSYKNGKSRFFIM